MYFDQVQKALPFSPIPLVSPSPRLSPQLVILTSSGHCEPNCPEFVIFPLILRPRSAVETIGQVIRSRLDQGNMGAVDIHLTKAVFVTAIALTSK